MRRSLTGVLFAALAVPASAAEDRSASRGLACAAPTMLQCAIIAPGFTRYFIAPFGVAPSDAEMAARVCGERKLPVASVTRKPTGVGPLSQTTAVEVACGARRPVARSASRAPDAARAPVVRAPAARTSAFAPPARDFEGERLTLSGPHAVDARPAARRRLERADRRDAALEERPTSRRPMVAEPRTRRAVGTEPARRRPLDERPAPAEAAADSLKSEVVRPSPVAPAPTEPARAEPRPPQPAPKPADPSIMYDHL